MYEVDLISTYFPTIEELTAEQLNEARVRVVAYITRRHQDLDLRPGSVAGDLLVEPMTLWLAGTTVAMGRFMSDLDLENVANNIIYNCDFVERYIGNFAVYDRDTLAATGVIRLTFNADQAVTLDRGTRYTFSAADEYYYVRLPQAVGDLEIVTSGQTPQPGTNQFRLVQNGLDSWYVDLPVYGDLVTAVSAGTTGLTDRVLPGQVGEITTVTDFVSGNVTTTLSVLAKKARETAYSSSVNSRHGVENMVRREWPDTNIVSSVLSGDKEMQRDTVGSPLLLPAPAIDIFYRSKRDNQQEQQTVELLWDPVNEVFRGEVLFRHLPSVIVATQAASDTDLIMDEVTYYTQEVTDRPGLTSAGSRSQRLWLVVVPPKDTSGTVQVPRVTSGDNTVGLFTITYLADPLLEAVATELESDERRAVGVSTSVRNGPLVVINSMDISYWRDSGVSPTWDSARTTIGDYINGVGWPECFTEAPIVSVMEYSGARRVKEITYDATLTFSPAQRILHNGLDFDTIAYPDLSTNSEEIPTVPITSGDGMVPDIAEADVLDAGTSTMGTRAATTRNVRYYINPQTIVINEV